ncbi:MAG: hypothetical protein HY670_04590 [Chloroflexi bacterium]|nr:hypothetical protein [Chloroflexota bacterium]
MPEKEAPARRLSQSEVRKIVEDQMRNPSDDLLIRTKDEMAKLAQRMPEARSGDVLSSRVNW